MRRLVRANVNVLIHWGVCGNSTFSLHVRDSPSRDGPSGRERHFESDGDASRTAECHYAHRGGGGHSTLNLFPICIRAATAIAADVVVVVVASVLQAGRRGYKRDRIRSRARFHPQVPVPERVPSSSPRVYTWRRRSIGKMLWIYRTISLLSIV